MFNSSGVRGASLWLSPPWEGIEGMDRNMLYSGNVLGAFYSYFVLLALAEDATEGLCSYA